MTVSDYINRFTYQEIEPEFIRLFALNAKKTISAKESKQWEYIHQRIRQFSKQQKQISSEKAYIYLGSRWEHTSPMIDMNCLVKTVEKDTITPLALAFHDGWWEVLGMEVEIDYKYVVISDLEVAAGLFWELTYYPIKTSINQSSTGFA